MPRGSEIDELIALVDPAGRATAAFLATYRLAGICADDRFAIHYKNGPEVFRTVLATSEALARGRGEAGATLNGLRERLREHIGPPGDEYEEPQGQGGSWFCDATDVAYYTITAWLRPEESARLCGYALGRVDSSVDFLDRDLAEIRPDGLSWLSGRSLSEQELDRQAADILALRGVPTDVRGRSMTGLIDASRDLQRRYGEAFQAVTR